MAKKVVGLEELLIQELQDIYDAEKQLVRAIPKMAKAASNEELRTALTDHLEVTKGQVQRLEQVFEQMDQRARSKPCHGMKGIVEEGQEMLQEDLEEGLMDSAITGAARKVEHYEMVSYEAVSSMAQQLGLREVAQLLQETMREEIQADKQLAQISKRLLKEGVSRERMMARGQQEDDGGTSGGSSRGRSGSKQSGSKQSSSRSGSGSSSKRSSGGGRSASSRGGSSSGGRGHSAHPLTDREEIQRWAEERSARPTCVRGTGGGGDTGMIRLDFPGYSGEESLEEISWDDWFDKFEERGLALMVQDTTARGQKSNFNKLVSRESAQQKGAKPKARTAR